MFSKVLKVTRTQPATGYQRRLESCGIAVGAGLITAERQHAGSSAIKIGPGSLPEIIEA